MNEMTLEPRKGCSLVIKLYRFGKELISAITGASGIGDFPANQGPCSIQSFVALVSKIFPRH